MYAPGTRIQHKRTQDTSIQSLSMFIKNDKKTNKYQLLSTQFIFIIYDLLLNSVFRVSDSKC